MTAEPPPRVPHRASCRSSLPMEYRQLPCWWRPPLTRAAPRVFPVIFAGIGDLRARSDHRRCKVADLLRSWLNVLLPRLDAPELAACRLARPLPVQGRHGEYRRLQLHEQGDAGIHGRAPHLE